MTRTLQRVTVKNYYKRSLEKDWKLFVLQRRLTLGVVGNNQSVTLARSSSSISINFNFEKN